MLGDALLLIDIVADLFANAGIGLADASGHALPREHQFSRRIERDQATRDFGDVWHDLVEVIGEALDGAGESSRAAIGVIGLTDIAEESIIKEGEGLSDSRDGLRELGIDLVACLDDRFCHLLGGELASLGHLAESAEIDVQCIGDALEQNRGILCYRTIFVTAEAIGSDTLGQLERRAGCFLRGRAADRERLLDGLSDAQELLLGIAVLIGRARGACVNLGR
nr:hypothetical protein [Rhizobium lusitanum]